jgi:phosphoglucomutase
MIHALVGETIIEKLIKTPGNNAQVGRLKVISENGWVKARPLGTEDIY